MDGRVFKVSHWYVVTCTHLSVKDNPFERLPGMIFVQYQVRRMFGWNWRMNLMRNYGCRGNRSFGLDDWRRDLRGHQFHYWVVRVYCCVLRLWNFGRSDFVRFLLLKTSASWKTSKIYVAWNAFPLPSSSLNSNFWMANGASSSWTRTSSSSSVPLATFLHLFSFMVANPAMKKNKELDTKKKEKRKKKKVKDDTYFDE